MRLAYDSNLKKITGYFESYTGWDEETKNSKFSCIFYIEGNLINRKASIKTYYPEDKREDTIEGFLNVINTDQITIKLPEEHGGCWNVQHFADKPENFECIKSFNWVQIRYVNSNKAYFYKAKFNSKKLKSYLIKGNIVFIEKQEGEWAFCSYFGKKTIKAWIKIADLNKL